MSAMPERAELAGGWCRVDSAPGRGTVVECWLPIRPNAAGARTA
jgi:signal transduction histidine kinase